MITTLTLNPSLDLTLIVDKLNPDDSNRVLESRSDPGGKGINVSRVLKRLGTPVTTIAMLGGHTGETIADLLRKEGLATWSIALSGETRTNVTISSRSSRKQTKLNQKGARITVKDARELNNLLNQLADNAKIMVLSGSLPPGMPADSYKRIITTLKKINTNLKIILDCDSLHLAEGIKAKPFMIKPNEYEIARLIGSKLNGSRELVRAGKQIQKQGVPLVVISRGAKGIVAVTPEGNYKIIPPVVEAKTSIGAGDSLVAGIAYGLLQGWSLKKTLTFGVEVSVATVMSDGTALASLDNIRKLKGKAKISRIE